MPEIILHHYELSPFSEKIRRLFAYKGIAWRGVEQPVVAPKPALTPLTGGYRRIPVLQIGADVYCDTALIGRVLERLYPTPVCFPPEVAGLVALVEDWADHRLFMQVVPPVVIELLPALPPEFLEDRANMSAGFSQAALAAAAPHARAQLMQSLDRLEVQLQASKYLLGASFSLADAACFHCIWFTRNSPSLFAEVEARPTLTTWFKRIEQFDAGEMQPMSAAAALAAARDASPVDVSGASVACPPLAPGRSIRISADDYGRESTEGRLVRLTDESVTVLREDPEVGEVAVHYPRAGYRITPS